MGRNSSQQLFTLELDVVGIDARFFAASNVLITAQRRHRDNGEVGQAGIAANVLRQTQSIHPRHFNIQRNYIRNFLLNFFCRKKWV